MFEGFNKTPEQEDAESLEIGDLNPEEALAEEETLLERFKGKAGNAARSFMLISALSI